MISSEARSALGCRGPWDAINLATVWGLGQERGVEAMGKECRNAIVSAKLKRTSYRGVIDVVYGGEKPAVEERVKGKDAAQAKGKQGNGQKRKADSMGGGDAAADGAEKPMSKRQMKKQAKEARAAEAGGEKGHVDVSGAAKQTDANG